MISLAFAFKVKIFVIFGNKWHLKSRLVLYPLPPPKYKFGSGAGKNDMFFIDRKEEKKKGGKEGKKKGGKERRKEGRKK